MVCEVDHHQDIYLLTDRKNKKGNGIMNITETEGEAMAINRQTDGWTDRQTDR